MHERGSYKVSGTDIVSLPIEKIRVLNPRVRDAVAFEAMVHSIRKLGLKRPITVMWRGEGAEGCYDLVCGQGRLEAFRELGQHEIPAVIVEGTQELGLIMSLVENIARRQHSSIELLQEVRAMKERGYSEQEIAEKTALTSEYIRDILVLLERGEYRLLRSVELGKVPLSVAMQIANSNDSELQSVLREAYEAGELKGRKLVVARQLAERRRQGKGSATRRGGDRVPSPSALVRSYAYQVEQKTRVVQKAERAREQLLIVTEALKAVFADAEFRALLQAEGLQSIPRNIGARVHGR